MSATHMEFRRERFFWIAVRVLVGVGAFAWGALIFFSAFIHKSPYWLIVGAVLGGSATIGTRDAGRRSLGTFLAALRYSSICFAVLLFLTPSTDVYIECLPWGKFMAISVLPMSLWLFLSSRAGRRESR
jgi:hypothetical protein